MIDISNNKELTLVSVFSGAMGLDIGLEKAGFTTKVALDIDKFACKTIKKNKPSLKVIEGDINSITSEEILKQAGLKKGEVVLLAGGSPCQSFSTAGKRRAFDDKRGKLLLRFIELVEEIEPEYFILENVKGILNASIKKRAQKWKNSNDSSLTDEEKKGSVLKYILNRLNQTGYEVNYALLNAADYGVPQTRERVFFIGSKYGGKVEFPKPTHSKSPQNGLMPWRTFKDVLDNMNISSCTFKPYSDDRMRYMKLIPAGGGNWRDLPKEIAIEAMGKAYYSGGGKVGFFRRIFIDKPCPTLLTSPLHKSTILGHPFENRPLSVEEYKAIQQFPDEWIIEGSIMDQYRLIGNAVPVGLAYQIGISIINHRKKRY
ncbi:MAG: DNA cytosine methyltransferase [Caloramator sp.]|nr:DNA cytosine methyltransferase [Caloramator sp.]